MIGYVLFDKDWNKLTRDLRFSSNENAGWLWTMDEMLEILKTNSDNGMAFYYQKCQLIEEEDGDVNVEPLEEAQEL